MDESIFIDNHELNTSLIGTWKDNAPTAGDSYTIRYNHLSYGFGGFINYAGTIKYVSNFSNNAGVIIIEYDADHKPAYYDYKYNEETEEWEQGDELPLKGNYIGIYFKELKPGVSVKTSGAYITGGAEEASLEDAIASFTAGNEIKYISYYGTYARQ